MKSISRFYDRECQPYARDRETVQAYASWLSPLPWKLFGTFTFAWAVSDAQAIKTFDAFINRLERILRSDIAYVRGDEKRFPESGKAACARHFHVAIACAASVTPQLVEELWRSMAGNRSDRASAQVRAYDSSQNGITYALKGIYQGDGEWAFRKLHLFLPAGKKEELNSRQRRVLLRHKQRLQFFTDRTAETQ